MAKKTTAAKTARFVPCRIMDLPEEQQDEARRLAVAENPANAPRLDVLVAAMSVAVVGEPAMDRKGAEQAVSDPAFLAALTGKYWGPGGVNLSVSFLDNAPAAVRDRILAHANAWGEFCNVKFAWSQSGGTVRIGRGAGGYWSYLGTDVRMIGAGQPTMNLQGFSANTSGAEMRRVVSHEFGHTLGFPHEQLRRAIVQRLDVAKTLEYFRRTQGWSEATTRSNVLTPLEERSVMGSETTDETSIMCYALPGSITTDGRAIPGGPDFSAVDREFAAKLYPPAAPPPVGGGYEVNIPKAGKWVWKGE